MLTEQGLSLFTEVINSKGLMGSETPVMTLPFSPTSDPGRELLRERFAMRSLLEFARTLTPDLGPDGILKSVQRTIMGKALITEAFAYLSIKKIDGEHRYHLVSRSGYRGQELPESISFEMLETWLFTPPDRTHFTLPVFDSDQQEIIGFLGFGRSLSKESDIATDQTFLESLSLLTGIALTNAALFESEKDRERYESELRLAREIQQSLLPQSLPVMTGVSFTAFSKQSELVGGDYYDIIKLDDHRVLVAIADVVGKGISAAILMSSLQASLRALINPLRSGQLNLNDLTNDLNRLIYESTASERYITAVFALIDTLDNKVTAMVCGHPRPIVFSSERPRIRLATSGVPLGVLPQYNFVASEANFEPGSYLALYTDGLSEAMSDGHRLEGAGVEEYIESLEAKGLSIESIEASLFGKTDFDITDDVTLVIVKRIGESLK